MTFLSRPFVCCLLLTSHFSLCKLPCSIFSSPAFYSSNSAHPWLSLLDCSLPHILFSCPAHLSRLSRPSCRDSNKNRRYHINTNAWKRKRCTAASRQQLSKDWNSLTDWESRPGACSAAQPKPLPVPPQTVSKNMLKAVGSNFSGATTHWEYLHETLYSYTAAFHGNTWCPWLNRGQNKLFWFLTNMLLGTNSSGRVFSLFLSRPVSQIEVWYLLKRKRKKKRHVQACPTHMGHITTDLLPNCFSKGCMPQATP